MRIERFGALKTGQLIPIKPNGKYHDHAFIPNELPPAWEPSASLWQRIAEARDRVATLDGAGGILPNPALLLRPLQRREAIKSNSIEGTYVTAEELLRFEAEKNQQNDPTTERQMDWREVKLYDTALKLGCDKIGAGAHLNGELFRELHRKLLMFRGKDKHAGQIRDTQVYVEAGRRYIPPPPDQLAGLISNLEAFLAETAYDPLVRAFIAHYQFEAIHPFEDGNGRIGRLILSLSIYKWLHHSHAWLYLSEFFDKNRREYLDMLLAVSTNGEWDEWIDFCLLGAVQQAESALATCRKLDAIKRRYEQQVGHLSSRMNRIISKLLCDPIISVGAISQLLGSSYNTAKSDIDKLVKHGILSEMTSFKRPKSYVAQEIFDIAYGD